VGFRTRLVSLALIPVVVGALSVHLPRGWMFDGAGGGWEYPAFLLFALAAQALLGDGAWALGAARAAPGAPASAARTRDACP
jgi:putative oxidoreductase